MKEILLLLGIIFCIIACSNEEHKDYVFFDDWRGSRVPLDVAIQRSHLENKPLLMWMSAHAYSFDSDLIDAINKTSEIKDYILDSMVDCRLLIDKMIELRKIKSKEMKVLLPHDINFKSEGHLAQWISRRYCDSLYGVMVVVDYKMNKYSPYGITPTFLRDSIAFMDFLRRAKYKYDSLYRQ